MNNSAMIDTDAVHTESVRILYIGRKSKVAEALERAIVQDDMIAGSAALHARCVQFARVTNQKAALATVRADPPHIVLLEVDGKPNSRLRFCEMLRYRLPTATILAVSESELNSSFSFDGKIALPLALSAVLNVLRNSVKRFARHQLELGHIRLNLTERTVHTHSGAHHMTPKQCALLSMLMKNHDMVVTRTEIMQTIWKTSYMEDTRTLDVHIRWLRERIEPEPSSPIYLVTVRGIGYRLSLFSAA
jgi:DNA-binding response OmpR family regulator